jgi:hypothetical protein
MTADPAIDTLRVRVYTVPTDTPEADGTITWDATTMVLVEAVSGTTTGLGWTYGAAAAGDVVTHQLAPVIVARCALDVPGSNEAMHRAVRNIGAPGLVAGAVSAVDIALWTSRPASSTCPWSVCSARLAPRCRSTEAAGSPPTTWQRWSVNSKDGYTSSASHE